MKQLYNDLIFTIVYNSILLKMCVNYNFFTDTRLQIFLVAYIYNIHYECMCVLCECVGVNVCV